MAKEKMMDVETEPTPKEMTELALIAVSQLIKKITQLEKRIALLENKEICKNDYKN